MGGEAKASSQGSLQPFRTVLRRLFTGFELVRVGEYATVDSGLGGVIWPRHCPMSRVGGYLLVPHVTPQTLDWDREAKWVRVGSPCLCVDLMPTP
jgi:hypothetical protein